MSEFEIYFEQILPKIMERIHLDIPKREFIIDVIFNKLTIRELQEKYNLTFRQVVYTKEKILKFLKEVVINDYN